MHKISPVAPIINYVDGYIISDNLSDLLTRGRNYVITPKYVYFNDIHITFNKKVMVLSKL